MVAGNGDRWGAARAYSTKSKAFLRLARFVSIRIATEGHGGDTAFEGRGSAMIAFPAKADRP